MFYNNIINYSKFNLIKITRYSIITILFFLILFFFCPKSYSSINDDYFKAVTPKYELIFKYDSKTFIDSTRKDFYKINFNTENQLPVKIQQSYDKSFITNHTDILFSLKYNFSDYQFFDVDQVIYFTRANTEDFKSFTLDHPKLKNLDSNTQIKYGIAIGQEDALQIKLDYNNFNTPAFDKNNFTSGEVNARLFHQLSENSALGVEGNYEERNYHNSKSYSYKEAVITLDWSKFLSTKYKYSPVSNAIKGNKDELLKFPTAIKHPKILEYYTTYETKEEENKESKYVKTQTRGETQLLFALDLISREYTSDSNKKYFQPQIKFGIDYEISENFKLNLSNTYYERKHQKEFIEDLYLDHSYNRLFLKFKQLDNSNFTYYYTFSNQRYTYKNDSALDRKINKGSIEIWYENNKTLASIALFGERSTSNSQNKFYPNSDLLTSVFSYDYDVSDNLAGHLKVEYTDIKYRNSQSRLFSSNIRKSWYTGIEQKIYKSHRVELGYSYNEEVHQKFIENNITEKTLLLTLKSNF